MQDTPWSVKSEFSMLFSGSDEVEGGGGCCDMHVCNVLVVAQTYWLTTSNIIIMGFSFKVTELGAGSIWSENIEEAITGGEAVLKYNVSYIDNCLAIHELVIVVLKHLPISRSW